MYICTFFIIGIAEIYSRLLNSPHAESAVNLLFQGHNFLRFVTLLH